MLKRIIYFFLGKKFTYKFFNRLHNFSLRGMNYYNAINLDWTGEKKLAEVIYRKNIKKKKFLLFDIGAHKGEYLKLFLDLFGNNLEAHVFEPQKDCIRFLKNEFGIHKNIFIEHSAVGNKNQKNIQLYTCPTTSLIATTFPFRIEDFNRELKLEPSEKVDMFNLLSYIQNNRIESIDLLKLDVEGMEYQCLESIESLIIGKKIKYIQFEYCFINMANRNYFFDFWQLLSDNYRIYKILRDGLHEIIDYSINLEQIAPINFLAELKK